MSRVCAATLILLAAAAAWGQGATPLAEVVYKKTPQGELKLFMHYPPDWKRTDRRAAIVFFFGGGWQNGTPNQFTTQAEHLAGRGMVAARADYRAGSRHQATPDQCVEDAKSAVRYLRGHAGELGIDPDRIVGSGGSAGGHIAACAALTEGLEAAGEDHRISSRPNALVLFNPAMVFPASFAARLPGTAEEQRVLAERISPGLHPAKGGPPAILFFGSNDALMPSSREFVERSKALGNRAELDLTDGQGHGYFNRSPFKEDTLRKADEFLTSLGYLPRK